MTLWSLSRRQVCHHAPLTPVVAQQRRASVVQNESPHACWCAYWEAHICVGMPIGCCSFLNHQRISLDTDVSWNFIYFGNHLGRSLALVKSRHCTLIMKSDGVTLLLFLLLQLCKGRNPPPQGLSCPFLLALYRPAWVAP